MRITDLYLNDISEYDNFVDKLLKDIEMKFWNKGSNSIVLSRFISYLRNEISNWIFLKHNKKINIIVSIPVIEKQLVKKVTTNNKENIHIRLDRDLTYSILNGDITNFTMYIHQIVEEVSTSLKYTNTNEDFNNYLILKMDILADICRLELSEYTTKEIISSKNWAKLTFKSTVFKDYYDFFQTDKKSNRQTFIKFLQKVIQS